jgi:hypothetical protein
MITPATLNSASVVAIAEHSTQNPGSFFVLIDAGRVWKGFTTVLMARAALYSFSSRKMLAPWKARVPRRTVAAIVGVWPSMADTFAPVS